MNLPNTETPPENWQSLADAGWIGKEHFESFQASHANLFSKTVVGAAFNNCIHGGGNYVHSTEPTNYGGRRITGFASFTPLRGLIVASRLDTDLGPYPRETNEYPSLSVVCRQYAIEVDSFLSTMTEKARQFERGEPMQSRDIFLQAVAGSLATYLAVREG